MTDSNPNSKKAAYRNEIPTLSVRHLSPLRLLAITIGGIFFAEVLVMMVVYPLRPIPYLQLALIDAASMTVLIFPLLYFLSFRPLLRYIKKSQQAEKALLNSLEVQESFFDSIDTLIAYMDRDYNFIRVNQAYAMADGKQPEFFIGRNHFNLYPHAENEAIFRRVVETGEAYIAHEKPFEYPDHPERGTTYWNWNLLPVRGADGQVEGLVLSLLDVTERKRAQEELRKANDELELRVQERTEELRIANSELEAEVLARQGTEQTIKESEEKYRSLFSNMSEGFGLFEIVLDDDGRACDYRCVVINDAFEELTGIPREKALGGSVNELLPNLEPHWIEAFSKVGLGGEPVRYENYSAELDKWFEAYCYAPKKNQFAVVFFDVTARRQAQEQLHYQAALLSNVNDAIIASDAQYRITVWNTAAELVYGWKREEVIGHNGLDITRTQWPEQDGEEMRRKIAETGRWRGEATQMRKDGTRFPVEVSSIVLFADDGKIAGYVSVNRDITERKSAEETLRLSQLDLDRAQAVGQIGSWRLDVRRNVLTWSDENHRIFGVPRGTPLTYETFLGIVHPQDQEYVDAQWKAGLAGAPYDIEHRLLVDGDVKWVREKAFLEFDETGNLLGGFGITQDITNIKKAEEALRRARDELEVRVQERTKELAITNQELLYEIYEREEVERQLRIQTTAMEAAANGILISDFQGEILWTNPALRQMTGYSEEELIGQNTRLLKSGKHDPDFYRQMWETVVAGKVWQGETINRRKDGSTYIEAQIITPVRNEAGQISHFIAIKHDITLQKQAEAELERRNLELQALSISERKQRQAADALRAATQALTKSLDIDTVLNTLLKHITDLVDTDIASVGFVEDETRLVSRNLKDLERRTDITRVPIFPIDAKTDFFFQRVASSHKSLLIQDATLEPDWIDYPGVDPMRSWLGVPILVNEKVIGVVLLGKFEPGFFSQEHAISAEALVSQAAVAVQNAWLFEQVCFGRERMQLLSRRLVEVQESERRYIARELHDQAGQSLTSLILGLGRLEKGIAGDVDKQAHIRKLKGLANDILEGLHRLAVDLRPASLDHLGLIPALEQLINSFAEDKNLEARFKSVGLSVMDRLPAEVETTLYRIVQEALTNISRHSKATRADIILEKRDGTILLIVEDNGIGFDATFSTDNSHLGLIGIRERTEMLGGTLTVESIIGSGTTLVVEVPNANSYFTGG